MVDFDSPPPRREFRLRLAPPDQPLELAPTGGPHPAPELPRHRAVLLAVDLAPQRRALQRASAEIEGERAQCIEPTVLERRPDEPQHRPLGGLDVAAQTDPIIVGILIPVDFARQ